MLVWRSPIDTPTPGGRIYAEVEGDLGRGAVLLATGGPGTSHDHYHPWFSRLAEEHAVVYLDYSGCGRSDRVADGRYSVELFARNIEHVRQELGVGSLAIVGLSFGAYPALDYALRHPDRLRALVISNGYASAETWQSTNIDGVNAEFARLFPAEWRELSELRAAGVSSLDDGY